MARALVPFDRSVCSRNALEYAFERFPDAIVTALFVEYPLFEAGECVETEDDLDDRLLRTNRPRTRPPTSSRWRGRSRPGTDETSKPRPRRKTPHEAFSDESTNTTSITC